jgi:hypothetical protein
MDCREEERADEETAGVDREDPRRAGARDDCARRGRAEDVRRALREREERIRLLQARRGDGLRNEGRRSRQEESAGRSGDALEGRQLPHVQHVPEEQRSRDCLRADAREVGSDHHGSPR